MNHRRTTARSHRAFHSAAIVALLAIANGCSTASSLGLPFTSGPHRLLRTSNRLRDQACPGPELPRELAKATLGEYLVEPGDVLVVEANDPASMVRLPADQPVQPDGRIDLGPYGRLQAAGKTVDQIEQEVRLLVANQRPPSASRSPDERGGSHPSDASPTDVSVRIVNRESKVFYVLGEVNAPGAYPLAGRETVLDAILAAGGLTDRANQHDALLARPRWPGEPSQVLPICYRQIVQLGEPETNYQVLPGDRIYVPSMTMWDDIQEFLYGVIHWDRDTACPRCRAGMSHAENVPYLVHHAASLDLPVASTTSAPRPLGRVANGSNGAAEVRLGKRALPTWSPVR